MAGRKDEGASGTNMKSTRCTDNDLKVERFPLLDFKLSVRVFIALGRIR